MSLTYLFTTDTGILSHRREKVFLLKDEPNGTFLELQAQVSSGDYFITLATQLDEICQSMGTHQQAEVINLERTIDDLLYLQHHYKIVKKTSKQ